MLVLTRLPGEYTRITVPPSDETHIIDVYNCNKAISCHFGFECDRSIQVVRSELFRRTKDAGEDC